MPQEALNNILAHTEVVIAYVPVRDEIDFKNFLPSLKGKTLCTIQPKALLDPFEEAKRTIAIADGRETVVLIPGTRFDATGTRHGKGAGWYDRFLSSVPASWIRIGLCTTEQFSSEPLVRESWDEPMDYLVVVPEKEPPRYYNTHARS